jgi:hypothetical protein
VAPHVQPPTDSDGWSGRAAGRVDARLSAPMSSSALGPLTAPSAQRAVQQVAPRGRASARSSRGPLTARRPNQVRLPAVHHGACGPEPAMSSRRWRVGSVGPPDPGRGCPELVKHILLTDIGVGMSQHPSVGTWPCSVGALRVRPPCRRGGSLSIIMVHGPRRPAGPHRAQRSRGARRGDGGAASAGAVGSASSAGAGPPQGAPP